MTEDDESAGDELGPSHYSDPPFNPLNDAAGSTTHYRPANEAARRLHLTWTIGLDLETCCGLLSETPVERPRKLLLRYLFLLLLSQDKHLRRLKNIAMEALGRTLQDCPNPRARPVLEGQMLAVKEAFSQYTSVMTEDRAERFRTIRNCITAHWGEKEGNLTPDTAAQAWRDISDEGVNEILAAIPPLFEALHKVSMIYQWVKGTPGGGHAFIQPLEWWRIVEAGPAESGCSMSAQGPIDPSEDPS